MIFQYTVNALNSSAFVYLIACFAYIIAMARSGTQSGSFLQKLGSAFVLLGFVLHTFGLGGRWYLGGIGRPPWTNLYESLVFFAWGVALFQVLMQRKWSLPLVGAISMPIVFLLMGMAVMTPNKTIEPLIPALQSNWLKIHVVFGMLSYAGFTMAGCLAFLHLMRSGASLSKIGAGVGLMVLMNLSIAGGKEYFKTGQFYMARTIVKKDEQGHSIKMKDRYSEYEGGPVITRMELVPGGTVPFSLTLASFGLATLFMWRSGRRSRALKDSSNSNIFSKEENIDVIAAAAQDWDFPSKLFFNLGLISFASFFGWVAYQMTLMETLTLYSNPYLTLLMFMTFVFTIFLAISSWRYAAVLKSLPSADRLDELGYKNILFAFPFQTLLLITGAVWAYYAWGRSWGWDPKEVGALITWLAYLIYLHGKLLMNWKPRVLSVVAILSFMILVFSFLGVNLVLSGLHAYGSA